MDGQRFPVFLKSLYIISIILVAYFLIDGFSFYKTGYQQRPRHEDYRNLRPAGDFGHGIGIVGSAMMLFMLLYSLRKRTSLFGKAGNLKSWLNVHIYFGIFGPVLVIIHSSFKVQGLILVSFWSMVAVALSGILGRYLYIQIPRNIEGEALDLKDIEKAKTELESELKGGFEIDEDIVDFADKRLSPSIDNDTGIFKTILTIFFDDLTRPFKIRKLKRDISKKYRLPSEVLDKLIANSRKKSLLIRKISLINQVQQLFHYWHVFHKPFAIIMYLIMFIHVGIAVWLGYTWLF